MSGSIRVTPDLLNEQGAELISYSTDLQEVMKLIESKVNEIIDGWDGLGQDGYYEMYLNMKESLNQIPQVIQALGQSAQGAAKAYSDVDEQLKNSFK